MHEIKFGMFLCDFGRFRKNALILGMKICVVPTSILHEEEKGMYLNKCKIIFFSS